MKENVYLQCGYEKKCKHKDCINCPRKKWKTVNFTLAEKIVIEDFAISDLKDTIERNPEKIELMQKIMHKLIKRLYKEVQA